MGRIIFGFVVSPALPALLLLAIQFFRVSPQEAIWFSTTLIAIAYGVALLVGAPVYLLMRKIGRLAFPDVLGAAAVLGAVPYFALFGPNLVAHGSLAMISNTIGYLLLGIAYGSVVGLLFWLIARPDKLQSLGKSRSI